jgi:hypothetical protein
MTQNAMKLDRRDNVAVALDLLAAGTEALVLCAEGARAGVALTEAIPFGFKLATRDIRAGSVVHVHNVEGIRARGDLN